MSDRLNSMPRVESFNDFAGIALLKSSRISVAVLALFLSVAAEIKEILADDGGKAGAVSAEAPSQPRTIHIRCIDEESMRGLTQRFVGFGDNIMANMNRYVPDPLMRDKLKRVFGIARANLEQSRCNLSEAVVPFDVKNPGLGFVSAGDGVNNTSFDGRRRRVLIPQKEDFTSLDLLLKLVHEFTHVDQDDGMRGRVPWDRYNAYWLEFSPAVLAHEVDAIERSIEVLNIATGGRLKAAARKGRKIDLPLVSPRARENIMDLAICYYTKDRKGFEKITRDLYRPQMGYVLFTVDLEREK